MAYNGKILARANADLADIRQFNLDEHARRVSVVHSRVPEISEIDYTLRSQMGALARAIFSQGSEEIISSLKEDNLNLQMRRAELLVENGFPKDYLDDIYSCAVCRDTGIDNGHMCSCLKKLYNKELSKELSTLLKNGDESFENFNISLYPEDCRAHMSKVFSLAKEYAEYFPAVKNLLLRGAPGLGKTYLSGCIAREVSEKGYSVYYASSIDVFNDFDAAKFKNDEEAQKRVDALFDCDLLILDDIGTELLLPSVTSDLYNIINTRINTSKGMILNTNMTREEIVHHYSEAIGSRIEGYFTALDFAGDDIRKKKL